MIIPSIPTADRQRILPASSPRLRRWTVLSALLLCLALASAAFAGPYCAIAYSKSTGRIGQGEGLNTRAEAESRALAECGAPDAQVVGWCRDGYLALALGRSPGVYGTGRGDTLKDAQARALEACHSNHARIAKTVPAGPAK